MSSETIMLVVVDVMCDLASTCTAHSLSHYPPKGLVATLHSGIVKHVRGGHCSAFATS